MKLLFFQIFFILLEGIPPRDCRIDLPITQSASASSRPNVLLLIADDLRPALGCYGEPVFTPNLDRLAQESYLFEHAFSQQAVCGPSRTSFLTGRRPDTVRVYDNGHAYFRTFSGNFTTLPQYFKEHGYVTASAGKIFHPGELSNFTYDYPYSWSLKHYDSPAAADKYYYGKVCPNPDGSLGANLCCPVNVSAQPLKTLPDLDVAKEGVKLVRQLANKPHPFFIAVGFRKPHIPWKYPEKFKEYYPLDQIKLAPNRGIPPKLPSIAWNPWIYERERDDIAKLNLSFPYGLMPDHWAKLSRQSYYSSVTYMDSLVGEVLAELETRGVKNNTIVAFISDHGWSLGEHGMWAKFNNFNVVTRIPFLLHVPASVNPKSTIGRLNFDQPKRRSDLVELLDLFPTLVEIAGLPSLKPCEDRKMLTCREGKSLFPNYLRKMEANQNCIKINEQIVFYQYPRPSILPQVNSDQPDWEAIHFMGYSARTVQFRYTEWVKFNPNRPKQRKKRSSESRGKRVVAIELYDLEKDPDENENIADNLLYQNVLDRMSYYLRLQRRRKICI